MRTQTDSRPKKSADVRAWDQAALATERADLERSHISLRAPSDPLQLAMSVQPASSGQRANARPKAR